MAPILSPPGTRPQSSGKAYFHIVRDPWLNGPEVQYSSWLIYLSLSSPPAVTNGAGVEELVREIEAAAADAGSITYIKNEESEGHSPTDATLINFHYSAHLHAPTRRTFTAHF